MCRQQPDSDDEQRSRNERYYLAEKPVQNDKGDSARNRGERVDMLDKYVRRHPRHNVSYKPAADARERAEKDEQKGISGISGLHARKHADHSENAEAERVHDEHEAVICHAEPAVEMLLLHPEHRKNNDCRRRGDSNINRIYKRAGHAAQDHIPRHAAADGRKHAEHAHAENVHAFVYADHRAGGGKRDRADDLHAEYYYRLNIHAVFTIKHFCVEQVCKPGSVLNDHLSRTAVADSFKPPPEDGRAGHVSSHGVAPDRVYSVHMSPCDE